MKIISRLEPKADECHGCPFKHNDVASLRLLVEKRKVSTEAMEEVNRRLTEKLMIVSYFL